MCEKERLGKGIAAKVAKVLRIGESQLVELPDALRFHDGVEEVRIWREDNRVILAPSREWGEEFWALVGSDPDFPTAEEMARLDAGSDAAPKAKKRDDLA